MTSSAIADEVVGNGSQFVADIAVLLAHVEHFPAIVRLGEELLRNGRLQTITKDQAEFSYRHSGFDKDVVLSASFRLPKGDKEELIRKRREYILKRNTTQPLTLPNSGSMFKNPPGTYAAKLIEQAGLKGKRVGNAQISEKHANFIVNLGDAKASDVLTLVDVARRTVHQNTGVLLELEVKLVGFPEEVRQKVA